jgi:uncharacterized membrane protein (UPF0127 family)
MPLAARSEPVAELESLFARSSLVIDSTEAATCYHFATYLARSDPQRSRGLMFVRSLPRFTAMLFWFPQGQAPAMWMRNTYIPLDMLFIDEDGRVVHVAADAEPHSLRTIDSPRPSRYVLEINGGLAEALGLRAGDRVLHAWFTPDWPEALSDAAAAASGRD